MHPFMIDTVPFSNFTLKSWSKDTSVVYSPVKNTWATGFSGIKGVFSGVFSGIKGVVVVTVSTVLSIVVVVVLIFSFEEAGLSFPVLSFRFDWLFLAVYGIVTGISGFTGSTYFGESEIIVCELPESEGRAGL